MSIPQPSHSMKTVLLTKGARRTTWLCLWTFEREREISLWGSGRQRRERDGKRWRKLGQRRGNEEGEEGRTNRGMAVSTEINIFLIEIAGSDAIPLVDFTVEGSDAAVVCEGWNGEEEEDEYTGENCGGEIHVGVSFAFGRGWLGG